MSHSNLHLTDRQLEIANLPVRRKIFLEGPAGAGKTQVGVHRLQHLLNRKVRPDSILVLVPQRTLGNPYAEMIQMSRSRTSRQVAILTIGGLARRMVELFWPLIAKPAGFLHPEELPHFLTLETAQYFMAHLVNPLIDQGYFNSITIERNRLFSQIIDNLNKAAVVGFDYRLIGDRLKSSASQDPAQVHAYEETQYCANLFREYCLQKNLLDFSLQIEIFARLLWPLSACKDYLLRQYTHIIVDNIEEDTPVTHDILSEWLPASKSALVISDWNAGYRRFLGSDPESALRLKDCCGQQFHLTQSFITPPGLRYVSKQFAAGLKRPFDTDEDIDQDDLPEIADVLEYADHRYQPDMIDWVAQTVDKLIRVENVPPSEIVVLSPFMSDTLRFSLANRFDRLGIPTRSHRPSRGLRDEPATLCLLTLAELAHPQWKIIPSRQDVVYSLMQSIDELDLVRAQLLGEITYRVRGDASDLSPFGKIQPDVQERITYRIGQRYELLRSWLEDYRQNQPVELDYFLNQLFGEVLSQPGYRFHNQFDAGNTAANLIESVQKFRTAVGEILEMESKPLGQEYIEMVKAGVIASQYMRSWKETPSEAVLIAPAYTFLMSNHPVDVQFWLNVGSTGWWERLYQPLTNPYILSREWNPSTVWTDVHEYETRQDNLYRLVSGLIHRCRRKVFMGITNMNEQGYEQQGPLLRAIQYVLRAAQTGV